MHPDSRGFAEHLTDLIRLIGLKTVPHVITFQKAADRLVASAPAHTVLAVLRRTLKVKSRMRRIQLAAFDGTGLVSRHISRYDVKRRAKLGAGTQQTTYSKYPKVVLITDCGTPLALTAVAPRRSPPPGTGDAGCGDSCTRPTAARDAKPRRPTR